MPRSRRITVLPRHWSADQETDFMVAAGQLMDVYVKLSRPHVADRGARHDRFENAVKATRAQRKAFARFTRVDSQILNSQLASLRADFRVSDLCKISKILVTAFDRLFKGIPVAEITDREQRLREAEQRLRNNPNDGEAFFQKRFLEKGSGPSEHLRRTRYRGRRQQIDAAVESLVRQLAESWAIIDGKQPSSAEYGNFCKMLKALLPDYDIGQKRLAKLVQVPGFAAPPRGPRGRR